MKAKLIGFMVLFYAGVVFAQNTTNETLNITEIPNLPAKWLGDYWIIVSNETIWCKDINEIDIHGAIYRCAYIEQENLCKCRVDLPAVVTPGYFTGLRQVEERYKNDLWTREQEIQYLSGWLYFIEFVLVFAMVTYGWLIFVYPKQLSEV